MTVAKDQGIVEVPICYINGRRVTLPPGRGEATLLQFLRERGLTGTKLGCGEGGCGACTVMLSHSENGEVFHRAVNACLCPLYAVEGMHVVTVEGIGNTRQGLHPVQERLASSHGSQCGFCTPGFVMSMYALLRAKADAPPNEEEIEDALGGNLCRCTGYRPILDAFKTFAKSDPRAYTEEAIAAGRGVKPSYAAETDVTLIGPTGNGGTHATSNGAVDSHALQTVPEAATTANGNVTPNGGPICPSSGMPCDCGAAAVKPAAPAEAAVTNGGGGCGAANGGGCGAANGGGCGAANGGGCGANCACKANGGCCAKGSGMSASKEAVPVRATVEPIFPPELKSRGTQYLKMPGQFVNWHRPATLQQLLELKKEFPTARLVVGSTEVGIEMKFKAVACPVIIAPTHVPELNAITVTDEGIRVGGAASLSRLLAVFKEQVAKRPAHETSTLTAVINQLRWFAGTQIRNVSSLGGNICTGSPISDLNPIWMASRTTFTLMGLDSGEREVSASEFFLGYRQVDIKPHEVLYSVNVPYTRPHEYVKEFKQSPRREDDIAIVNAGMRVLMNKTEDGSWVFQEAEVAYGGVAAKAIMARKLAAALVGQPLDETTLQAAIVAVRGDVSVAPGAPGGRSEYRNSLAASFVFKFFIFVANQLEKDEQTGFKTPFPADYASAGKLFERHPAHGVQFYAPGPVDDVVGQPHQHMAANLQVCGEATYTDDIKLTADALIAAVVTSSRPHARLKSVDATAALGMPGVVGFYSAKDVPGSNKIGPVMPDEEVYASEFVTSVGQIIGVIVAETEDEARRAARAVVVEYEDLPAVMSCEEAVAAGQFYEYIGKIDCGDVDEAFASNPAHVVEGTFKVGGQEHFYLETNVCCVIPLENEEYVMYSSTQAPAKHQKAVAHVLHVPAHKIVSRTKRLGGGFGGKETRGIFLHCAVAVPAYHLQRPVKIALDRDEDMQMTGHRHAFMCKYKVGCDADGKIVAVDLKLFSNVGNSYDLSTSIMDRALMHSDNTYKIPNMRIRGNLCKTNQSSNTAFRGFGGPQGLMFCEMWMDQIARTVGKPPAVVRELNLYQEGETTPFTQVLKDCRARPCWDTVMAQAGFSDRLAAAAEFNAQNRWRKRGIAATPTKFGISFTTKFLNQAGALVHAYLDGTVLVTHGGVEMGQGLHTKMAQVAAQALGVPLSQVFISETATDKVPNASPTAASASSDMYGGAVLDACKQIADRLAPYRAKAPSAKFKELVNAAYLERIDLSAHGFYRTPDITGFGGVRPFNYLCYGAAVSEVELDTLTGDWHLLRTDIVMDVGNPLNPAIDIGQVEGGFVQGMGWTCIEELQWGDKEHAWVRPGHLFTKGPGTYKIPSVNDIPIDFRVTLLHDAPNDRAIHSSKAVGEPPLFLGASVFFALKEAVYAARAAAGHPGYFVMDAPATPERLRMLCADEITAPLADAQIRPHISC